MEGGDAWAMVDPSWNSTIEWIICCGCTTTSIRSKGMSNSRWASITSSPLLTSVAELVVMTGPIAKLGWARASVTVTCSRSARLRPRKGPPLAVTTRRRTSAVRAGAQALGDGAVLAVHGNDLAGRGGALDQGAADDQGLLVGQGERRAGCQGRQGRLQADRAGDAVEHDVGAEPRQPGVGLGPHHDLGGVAVHSLLAGGLPQGGPDGVGLPGGHPDGVHPQGHGLRGEQLEVARRRR